MTLRVGMLTDAKDKAIAESLEDALFDVLSSVIPGRNSYIAHGLVWKLAAQCYVAETGEPTREGFLDIANRIWDVFGQLLADRVLELEREEEARNGKSVATH